MSSTVDVWKLSQHIERHGGHRTLWAFDGSNREHGETLLTRLIHDGNVSILEPYSRLLADKILENVVSSYDTEATAGSRIERIRTNVAGYLQRAHKDRPRNLKQSGKPQSLPEEVCVLSVSDLEEVFKSLDQSDEFRRAYDMYFRSRGVPTNLDMVSMVKHLIDRWNSVQNKDKDSVPSEDKGNGAWLLERLAVYSGHSKNGTIGNMDHLRKQYTELAFYALSKRCGIALVWSLLCLPSGRRRNGTAGSQQMPNIIKEYLDEYEVALRKTHDKLHLSEDTYELLSAAACHPLDLSEDDCNENSTVRFVILDQLIKQDNQKDQTDQERYNFYQSIVQSALSKLRYTKYASHTLWLAFTVSAWALAGAGDKDELYRAVTLCQEESRACESLKLLRNVLQLLEQSLPGKAIAYEPLRLDPVPPEYFAWCEVDEQTSWAETGSRLSSLYDEVRISFRRLVRAR